MSVHNVTRFKTEAALPLAALPLAFDSWLCHTLRMRVVGKSRIPGPQLMPSAQGLVAARAHQNAGLALAAVRTTGIRHGIYRFASHEEMNRATEEALVVAIRLNVRARCCCLTSVGRPLDAGKNS